MLHWTSYGSEFISQCFLLLGNMSLFYKAYRCTSQSAWVTRCSSALWLHGAADVSSSFKQPCFVCTGQHSKDRSYFEDCQFYQFKSTFKKRRGQKSCEAYISLEEKYLCTDRPVILRNNIHDSFIGAQPSPPLFLCGKKGESTKWLFAVWEK